MKESTHNEIREKQEIENNVNKENPEAMKNTNIITGGNDSVDEKKVEMNDSEKAEDSSTDVSEAEDPSTEKISSEEPSSEISEEISSLEIPLNAKIYAIRLLYNYEICYTVTENDSLIRGQLIVVETDNGPEIAQVLGKSRLEHDGLQVRKFIRVCTKEDIEKKRKNEKRARDAFKIALEKIKKHQLDMKLVSVHYFLDDNKVLFNFTADERVDFRELVKDLAAVFKKRIELRQIGARDEAKIIQGIGVCGRPFCCNSVKYELQPVTIKMAKDQNLTLNSSKISGACGRLLCCLAYEHDYYHEIKSQYPEEGAVVEIDGEKLTLVEINVIRKTATLKNEEGITVTVPLEKLPRVTRDLSGETVEEDVIIEDI